MFYFCIKTLIAVVGNYYSALSIDRILHTKLVTNAAGANKQKKNYNKIIDLSDNCFFRQRYSNDFQWGIPI